MRRQQRLQRLWAWEHLCSAHAPRLRREPSPSKRRRSVSPAARAPRRRSRSPRPAAPLQWRPRALGRVGPSEITDLLDMIRAFEDRRHWEAEREDRLTRLTPGPPA